MELRDLKAFVTLGEVLHFGQAAARQHVTQSALSKQIRRLEADLGGELFELEDARLYRGNGMVLGQAPDHIQRGLKGLDVCRTLRPDRGALPKLKGKGFGD